MLGRLAAVAVVVGLASCANVQPAGRNAERAPAPLEAAAPAPRAAPAAPPLVLPQPAPAAQAPAPPVAAPGLAAPPAPQRRAANDDIVVPGEVNRQVRPPAGDPRTVSERMSDVRAWDQCVTQAQAAGEGDPMRPQLDMPEDYCAQALGMADRASVPISRRIPR